MDCLAPGSTVHGSLQERILEWVVIPFSRGSSQPRDWTWVSRIAGRCGAARAGRRRDLGFGFAWNGGIPCPHQVTWSQPIDMCLARKREPIRGKLKSPQTPKFEKSPGRFGPIRLLCKQVTNPLKPATNCLCTPYKLGNSLGSALSDPVPLLDARQEPWLESAINFPFFCELHCLGSLLSSRSGIRTSGLTADSLPSEPPGKPKSPVHRASITRIILLCSL